MPALDDQGRPLVRDPWPHTPEYMLPFTPPVLFYRRPDDLNVGIIETLAAMPEASVAIDPLCGQDWGDFVRACRVRNRIVYGWTRVYEAATWSRYLKEAGALNLDGDFPNVEDDDLRKDQGLPLAIVELSESRWILGVLTNYFVSPEWPVKNALARFPVLPEIFPSEIHDPTWSLEGSLDSGRKHFAASLPLLDGRELRGLAAFNYPAGAFAVWPADNVEDWRVWCR